MSEPEITIPKPLFLGLAKAATFHGTAVDTRDKLQSGIQFSEGEISSLEYILEWVESTRDDALDQLAAAGYDRQACMDVAVSWLEWTRREQAGYKPTAEEDDAMRQKLMAIMGQQGGEA